MDAMTPGDDVIVKAHFSDVAIVSDDLGLSRYVSLVNAGTASDGRLVLRISVRLPGAAVKKNSYLAVEPEAPSVFQHAGDTATALQLNVGEAAEENVVTADVLLPAGNPKCSLSVRAVIDGKSERIVVTYGTLRILWSVMALVLLGAIFTGGILGLSDGKVFAEGGPWWKVGLRLGAFVLQALLAGVIAYVLLIVADLISKKGLDTNLPVVRIFVGVVGGLLGIKGVIPLAKTIWGKVAGSSE
jgi:hypothetical protein